MSATTLNTAALLSAASALSDFIESLDWSTLSDSQLSKLESAAQQSVDLVLEVCIDAGQELPEYRKLSELDGHLFDEMVLRHEARECSWDFAAMHEVRESSCPHYPSFDEFCAMVSNH